MKKLTLSSGESVLLDDEDFDWANQWLWTVDSSKYAVRTIGLQGNKENVYLHIEIMKKYNLYSPDLEVDHKNRLTFDCQKENLRMATRSQQCANRAKILGSKSKYKGVTFEKSGRLRARYQHDGVRINLGSFDSAEDAAKAYDKAVKRVFGEFAVLNFPEDLDASS